MRYLEKVYMIYGKTVLRVIFIIVDLYIILIIKIKGNKFYKPKKSV